MIVPLCLEIVWVVPSTIIVTDLYIELNDISLKSSTSKYVLHKKQLTFYERIGLSSITILPADKIFILVDTTCTRKYTRK